MPIQFTQQTPQGVSINYNVVKQLTCDPNAGDNGLTFVQLDAYIDKNAYDNGAQPFPGQGFSFPSQLDLDAAEKAIIARPEWAGATQVS